MTALAYTSADIAQALKIPLRKVITYIERGFLDASVQAAQGRGSKRLYTYADAALTAVCDHMRGLGSPQMVRRAVAFVRRTPALLHPDCAALVVFDSKAVHVTSWARFGAKQSGALLIWIDFEALHAGLRGSLLGKNV